MIFLGLQGPANPQSALKTMMKSSLFMFRFETGAEDFLGVIYWPAILNHCPISKVGRNFEIKFKYKASSFNLVLEIFESLKSLSVEFLI